jgi:4-amino-4-deoxy-L-arabinose transferase-like glycosyltransferase
MKRKPMLAYLWVSFILVLAGVHFIHLQADFPNYSRWMEWAKYTDEGWYANGAIQHFVLGHWYVPGDFNMGPVVPVWQLLVGLLFHFTGVSLVAVRALAVALFCVNLALAYRLVRMSEERWVAALCASMIASSSFLFCLSRLAIVEPLLIFFMLTSLLWAMHVKRGQYSVPVMLGLLFFLMVLTKTTAIFLLPALLYSLWYPLRREFWAFVRAAATMGAVAGTFWSAYFFGFVRPHYLEDYRYVFKVNVYEKPHTFSGWIAVLLHAIKDIVWVDWTLAVVCLLLVCATAIFARGLWRKPLFVASLLAIGGYILFVTYINNMQPRYYVVIAFFLFIAVAMAVSALLQANRWAGRIAIAVCVFAIGKSAWETGGFVYRYASHRQAARGVHQRERSYADHRYPHAVR